MQIANKKIVITAGGTIEEIDPVRYISNYSSGKMGTALADVAHENGANVVLITTVETEKPYKVTKVKSALDMQKAVEEEFATADCLIMAAAVADYRPKEYRTQKMKKTSDNEITLQLVKNPDILKEICEKKNEQVVVGFCAETENLTQNATVKLKSKNCDYLIANDISRKDIGFSSDYNEVTIFSQKGNVQKLDKADKYSIAKQIFEVIYG